MAPDLEPPKKWRKLSNQGAGSTLGGSKSLINALDDGCLMHIFSFLAPIPDRYNTALVCHRWRFLACHPRLWLRVDRSAKDSSEPDVFPNIEAAVSAARPGDTILIAAGGVHLTSDIQIDKPLCLIGGGDLPEETTLVCSRGSDRNFDLILFTSNGKADLAQLVHCSSDPKEYGFSLLDSALEFLSTCKISNLTVRAELGCCLLHRKGRLIIDSCVLQCESNPLDYLSCPIVSTAITPNLFTAVAVKGQGDGMTVSCTRIEGGAKAVRTSGNLALQWVRVIYARSSILFWFDLEHSDGF